MEKYFGIRARQSGLMREGLKKQTERVDLKRVNREMMQIIFEFKISFKGPPVTR